MVRVDWRLRRTYIGRARRRLHHGLAGIALVLVGIALALHDRRDFPWRFTPD